MATRSKRNPGSTAPGLALVTGGNRGLGRETCRQLEALGWRVLLAARDGAQARGVAAELSAAAGKAGGSVEGIALDVADAASVDACVAALGTRGQSLAALVNNAGVSLTGFNAEVVRGTLAVNYHGAARVTDALWPLLARDANVVMVSSGMGELSGFAKPLAARLLAPSLDRAALDALLAEFLAAAERGDVAKRGWPRSAYSVSKAALNALTRVLTRERPHGPRVNAVCPGWVRTDMGGRGASRGVEAGARGIVWAATLGADGPRGGFFRDGKPIAW